MSEKEFSSLCLIKLLNNYVLQFPQIAMSRFRIVNPSDAKETVSNLLSFFEKKNLCFRK